MSCTFCKILRAEIPASKVYEDRDLLAFLDIHPIAEGHTLIIPRRHCSSFTELTADEAARMIHAGQIVATCLKKILPGCEGITISLADGEAAGQEVPHAHLHVIPRRPLDGFGWKFPEGYGSKHSQELLDSVALKIRKAIVPR